MLPHKHMTDPQEKDLADSDTSVIEDQKIKSNFEIYCDEHPDALECRIYED